MMAQEELIRLYSKYIQSCKEQYGKAELSKGIKEARLAQFAYDLRNKAQQLLLYAKGTKGVDVDLFTVQLNQMSQEVVEHMKNS